MVQHSYHPSGSPSQSPMGLGSYPGNEHVWSSPHGSQQSIPKEEHTVDKQKSPLDPGGEGETFSDSSMLEGGSGVRHTPPDAHALDKREISASQFARISGRIESQRGLDRGNQAGSPEPEPN